MVMAHYAVYSSHDPLALLVAATNIAATLPVGRVEVCVRGSDGFLGITVHDVRWPEWCLYDQRIFKAELSGRFIALHLSEAIDPDM
jgi:hypothetical protein